MATSPTKISAADTGAPDVHQPPADWQFLLTEAQGYRSRETITLVQSPNPWLPGTFITAAGTMATTAAGIQGILAAGCNTVTGPRAATVIVRDAEVNDAYLMFNALDPDAVATELIKSGIVIRQGVLPNTAKGTFNPAAALDIATGIPPATPAVPPATMTYPQEPSYSPSTWEADDPAKVAAGSPQPAPARTRNITSGTYNNTSGVITLQTTDTVGFGAGQTVTLSALTGTGAFASLNGAWPSLAGTGGSTLVLQGTAALGASTITGGVASSAMLLSEEEPQPNARGGPAASRRPEQERGPPAPDNRRS
jgi:hypothetical protein